MKTASDVFAAMEVSASGLAAQRTRMNIAASNLANAQTTRANGNGPYKRRDVVLSSVDVPGVADPAVRGVAVTQIAQDASPPRLEYDPGHPDANAQGYVAYPNINAVEEMVDMITASRAYEAGITTMSTAVNMAERALGIGEMSIAPIPPVAVPPVAASERAQPAAAPGASFGNVLADARALDKEATAVAEKFANGDPSAGIHETVIAAEKANIALRYAATLKNKALEAYRELMNTQV